MAATAATAYIAKGNKDTQWKNGVLVNSSGDFYSEDMTCRTAFDSETTRNCNNTGAGDQYTSSVVDGVLTSAPTSDGVAGNTTFND